MPIAQVRTLAGSTDITGFHPRTYTHNCSNATRAPAGFSVAGAVNSEPPLLGNVKVLAEPAPDVPGVDAGVDELLGRPRPSFTDMENVGMGNPLALLLAELVGEELMEFRQTHTPHRSHGVTSGLQRPKFASFAG